jgi:hypothetical protein
VDAWFVFLVVIFAVGAVVVVVIAQRQEKERRERLRTLAGRLGFEYRQEGEPLLHQGLGGFRLFSRGRSRKHLNLMQGEHRGTSVTVSEYQYVSGGGNSRATHRQTVLLLESDRLDLPSFQLRPEHFGDRLAAKLGSQDIEIAGQPLFSEAYLLQGDDETAIRACFDDAVASYLARNAGLHLEGQGRLLLLYRPRHRLEPGAIEAFVGQGLELVRLFSRSVEEEEPAETEPSFMEEALAALRDLGVDA